MPMVIIPYARNVMTIISCLMEPRMFVLLALIMALVCTAIATLALAATMAIIRMDLNVFPARPIVRIAITVHIAQNVIMDMAFWKIMEDFVYLVILIVDLVIALVV